jgi:glutamate carboxypeptidase
MIKADIYGWLDTQRPAMEDFLQRLVDIDSNSYDKAGTDAVADAIVELLALDGVAVERHPVDGFGDVLAAHVPGRADGAHALLMGHRDTVFPKGTVSARGYTRDGDLGFGPGVADMKSGLVLNCFVLRAFARAGGAPFPIRALFTSDEEIGSAAGRPFIERAARGARAVLNAEPGRITGNVVTSRKGGATLTLDVTGRAAHSGMAHADGISAIEVLARKIVKLHALTDYATGLTINVGLISGGVSVNTVAPSARGQIDVRVMSLAQLDEVMARIEAIVAAEELPGATATLTRGHVMLPLEERYATDLMDRYRRVAAEIGFAVDGEFTGGCADSGFTASLGVPTLCGLGPVGGKPHTDREFCRLETMVPRAQAIAGTILDLA